jgi:hypothetical protein
MKIFLLIVSEKNSDRYLFGFSRGVCCCGTYRLSDTNHENFVLHLWELYETCNNMSMGSEKEKNRTLASQYIHAATLCGISQKNVASLTELLVCPTNFACKAAVK